MKNILWLLIFFVGCATKPLKTLPPPELSLRENSESNSLLIEFQQATRFKIENEPGLACKKYHEIKDLNITPLKDVAVLKIIEFCPMSKGALIDLWKSFTPQSFSKEYYYELSLKLANNLFLEKYIAKFSFELSAFKKAKSEKIKLIKSAILISNKLEDRESEKEYSEKLNLISPKFTDSNVKENKLKIAKDFESARDFQKARSLYEEIILSNEFELDEKIKALNANRMSYKVERNLKVFLEKTFEMEQFLSANLLKNPTDQKSIDAWIESKITLSKAVWTEHELTKAIEILNQLLDSKLGNPNQKANIYWILASISLEEKNYKKALEYLQKGAAQKSTDLSMNENIQWTIVWNHYLLKQYREAASFAENFAKPSANPLFYNKLYYWKGKALQKMNKAVDASKVFENLFINDPFGFYGLISSIEIGAEIQPLLNLKQDFIYSGNNELDWLMVLDETQLAQIKLKEIDSTFKTIAEREKAMKLYRQTKWYQGAMRQLTNFPLKLRTPISQLNYDVLFPTPNLEIVDAASTTFSVPKEYILGITRQESNFIATERSWADAFGLMQLIPELAKELSSEYKIPYNDYTDLYSPEVNIMMGAAHLSDLRKRHNFKFIQSTASYNASEEAIRTWVAERFNGNYFEFIENIPYEETRNYVKLVFRNYITYKRLLNNSPFKITQTVFDEVF